MAPLQSIIHLEKHYDFQDATLLQGLPGIGFVGNIAVSHLIRELEAKRLAAVFSPHFQDAVYTATDGGIRRPSIELYYTEVRGKNLILLYGNTQPLTRYGQYEVSGKILDLTKSMGCKDVICLAGFKRDYLREPLNVFCTASDFDMLERALKLGIHPTNGYVYGMAGLLIGLAKLKEMRGLCLLAETLGTYPDALAAKTVLEKFTALYALDLDFKDLGEAAENIHRSLHSQKL